MEPVETIFVAEAVVACDGGNGPLGHPRVFLHIDDTRQIDCPYCGRRYILKDDVATAAGGH